MYDPEHRLAWPARGYRWATERLYHEFAWAYDAVSWLVSLGRWSGWRRQALAYVGGPRVLELGFGTGELLIEMAGRGWQAVGLERSPAMQRVTARKLRRQGLRVPRLCGAAQALPLAAASLDAIVATFPADYILAPGTWHEAARALRPGGRLVIAGLFVELDLPALRPGYSSATQRIAAR
ncbi:MAG TPA: class I SAM-dependent methyltransferase, partial [Anaerolineae bacterium]|nr:class I SAM-dependent methyltransferase [Anaerolineae bacterium]